MEKPKINNYNSLENIDENREKFVQEFNEKVVDLDFLENSDNAFKMTKSLEDGKKIDVYTVHKGDFNLLVSSPFLDFMNPREVPIFEITSSVIRKILLKLQK